MGCEIQCREGTRCCFRGGRQLVGLDELVEKTGGLGLLGFEQNARDRAAIEVVVLSGRARRPTGTPLADSVKVVAANGPIRRLTSPVQVREGGPGTERGQASMWALLGAPSGVRRMQ